MATVDENSSQLPMPEWDAIVNKNEELQAGDWHKMSSEEKKAGKLASHVFFASQSRRHDVELTQWMRDSVHFGVRPKTGG